MVSCPRNLVCLSCPALFLSWASLPAFTIASGHGLSLPALPPPAFPPVWSAVRWLLTGPCACVEGPRPPTTASAGRLWGLCVDTMKPFLPLDLGCSRVNPGVLAGAGGMHFGHATMTRCPIACSLASDGLQSSGFQFMNILFKRSPCIV